MKLVIAIIKPSRLEEVRQALNSLDVHGMTVMGSALGALALMALPVLAQDAAPAAPAPALDTGNTAWMLTSTALVLMMTIPGLALFYGGMVRKKNVLATVMQSFAITCLVTVLWVVAGYSIAFIPGGAFFGGFDRFMLNGMLFQKEAGKLTVSHLGTTIPESVYMTFQ